VVDMHLYHASAIFWESVPANKVAPLAWAVARYTNDQTTRSENDRESVHHVSSLRQVDQP